MIALVIIVVLLIITVIVQTSTIRILRRRNTALSEELRYQLPSLRAAYDRVARQLNGPPHSSI